VSGGIVIVGGGLEGLSIARALTSREAGPVTVLERDELAAAMTSKSSGIIRCHYGVPSLAAMAWQSLPVLRDLGADAGFRQTGYVVGVGDADVAALQANVAMQQAVGVDVGLVDHDAVAAMWPVANLADFAAFAYEPQGGYGDGYLTAQAFGRQARGSDRAHRRRRRHRRGARRRHHPAGHCGHRRRRALDAGAGSTARRGHPGAGPAGPDHRRRARQ
jgi:sarcosine oxidase subunit beta